ncbi:MAG: serine hydrolase [Atopobiaceae bacterium]|nr:serine hydrolase [Atopobiaceae bacterium]
MASKLVQDFIKHAEEQGFYILGAQVRKDGEVTDEWTRFPAKPRFETYSVAKTYVGAAAGIALAEGLFDLDEPLAASFPEETYDVTNEYALSITPRHLLTMTSGLSETMMWRDGWERKNHPNWPRYFFTDGKFDNEPGSVFLYNNANPYMLGCLIEKRAGQNIREYLRYRLFEPLGIGNVEWGDCPLGHTIAANALSINIDEMGLFGQLLVNGGEYGGKQLVPWNWVADMLTAHTQETGEFIPSDPPQPAGYGYQTWIDPVNNAGYMWGIFGQYCVMLPDKNAVVSVISLDINDGGSNGQYETSPVRKLIWDDLVTQV